MALLWANGGWADQYSALWRLPLGLRIGPLSLERSLAWVVNDGEPALGTLVSAACRGQRTGQDRG